MKYWQPFDLPSSPDASYTNGDANVGLQGSIPAAQAIEHPQREIVNFITDSGLTPNASDLHQLGESVQAARVAFGVDAGTSGVIVTTLIPPPPSYEQGMVVRLLVANNIPGPTTINLNGLGAVNTKFNGLSLPANILRAGDVGEFIFDGTNFQLIGGARQNGPVNFQQLTNSTRFRIDSHGAGSASLWSGTFTKRSSTSNVVVWFAAAGYSADNTQFGPAQAFLTVGGIVLYATTSNNTSIDARGQTVLNGIFTGLASGTTAWDFSVANNDAPWNYTFNPNDIDNAGYYPTSTPTTAVLLICEIEP